jgi:hypothetical protein
MLQCARNPQHTLIDPFPLPFLPRHYILRIHTLIHVQYPHTAPLAEPLIRSVSLRQGSWITPLISHPTVRHLRPLTDPHWSVVCVTRSVYSRMYSLPPFETRLFLLFPTCYADLLLQYGWCCIVLAC